MTFANTGVDTSPTLPSSVCSVDPVCAVAHQPMSMDEELENHITTCWQMVTQEYERGNREGADYWREAAQAAQKLRSPEQIKRMEEEQGLNAPCFFYEAGGRAALAGASK